MKKVIHKTIIQVEILHEEAVNISNYSLGEIAHEINEGSWSGVSSTKEANVILKGVRAARAIKAQGSDPEFFGMDEQGNETDY